MLIIKDCALVIIRCQKVSFFSKIRLLLCYIYVRLSDTSFNTIPTGVVEMQLYIVLALVIMRNLHVNIGFIF